jgi:hypothetical protein
LYCGATRCIIGELPDTADERGTSVTVTELYEAYAGGKITRGAFIRRLAAFGMSVPIAVAYADSLARPSSARAADLPGYADYYADYYDLYAPA